MMENKSNSTLIIIIGIIAALCCICLLVAGIGGYGYYIYTQTAQITGDDPFLPIIEEVLTPTSVPEVVRPPADTISNETLTTIEQSLVPENDPYELACRLQGLCDIPTTVETKLY